MQHLAKVIEKEGRKTLAFQSKNWWRHCLEHLKIGTKVYVSVTEKKPTRSVQQNRYYWMYLTLIAQETGHTKEEIHEWAKGMFLTERIVEVMGHKVRIRKSTTQLSKDEFSYYIQQIEEATGIESPPTEDYDI